MAPAARDVAPLGRAELAVRGTADGFPRLGIGLALVEVDPDPPVRAGDVLPAGVMVLPGGTLVVGSRLDLPRTDGDAAPGPVDADPLQKLRQHAQELGLRRRVGHGGQQQVLPDPGETVAARCPGRRGDGAARRRGRSHARLGEEYHRADKGQPDPALPARGPGQQGLEFLGLLIGQRQRVVEAALATLAVQYPGRVMVGQPPPEILDLD